MSAEQDKVRSIAERVASRLGGAERFDVGADADARGGGDEVAQLRDALREMQQRLAQIESRVGRGDAGAQRAPRDETAPRTDINAGASSSPRGESRADAPRQLMSTTYVPATHPSQERFGIDDAVTELVDFFEGEKTCGVEPGKTCDHCAMCSTRGF